MIKAVTLLICLLVQSSLFAQDNLSALIPFPNKIVQKDMQRKFTIAEGTYIELSSDSLSFEAEYLQKMLRERMGVTLSIKKGPAKNGKAIKLEITPSIKGREHYVLNISDRGISVTGATRGAVFYGITTLDQILLGDIINTKQRRVSALLIEDQPRIASRMLMLDPARHFLPIDDVKLFVAQMAKYKYNVLQLHLTDDQGWRIEIKKYPMLTDIGARRNPKGGMKGPDNGFYTQEQLRDLVRYAADRNVEIIPEIDIPGHTSAIIAAYPQLGCKHTDTLTKVIGKNMNLMLCASNDAVYEMYKNIIGELAAVFPSKQIHLGGDESVIEENWAKCDRCQSLKKRLNYEKDSSLMNYFFGKMLSFVREEGKLPLLWCELDNIRLPASKYLFSYPKDATLISWRNDLTPKCIELTRQSGNPLILAPGEFTYFDYPQYTNDLPEENNWGMPITTLKKVYAFDPGYGLSEQDQAHIVGVCGTLWGEAIKDINRAFYMTYPRALALAEAGWTNMEHRSWDSFRDRMYSNLSYLLKAGVSFRVPFELAQKEGNRDGVAHGLFENIGHMIGATAKTGTDLLNALMEPVYVASEVNPVEEAEKRREKKRENLDQSQGIGR
ncbi:family 20 glycosylhydrolase [Pedobacter sp. LMG 31462]|uniref:beta-N-acetylhexosaminidase n=2 Tax=Pedobacter gandavensis TaxID=2679963 RepID=A0ABR6ETM2_9SPHI|nr:family 20 glycosylhydrolase [Pedobacter gandavensis]